MTKRAPVAALALLFAGIAGLPPRAHATPPRYATFGRDQRIAYAPSEGELMRIWMVYVGQGDGLLIQLPPAMGYDPDPTDGDPASSERLDIAVDGGSASAQDAARFLAFVEGVYGGAPVRIEHAVLTHHDQDHVRGFAQLLDSHDVAVESVYHNGLASWRAGARGFPATGKPAKSAVYDYKDGKVARGLAFVGADGVALDAKQVVDDLAELRAAYDKDHLQGVYEDLARAVTAKTVPERVRRFDRAMVGAPFVVEAEAASGRGIQLADIEIEPLWPRGLRSYGGGNWGETINGNSVTFRLRYRDFEMLFTGDHNEKSEEALLADLQAGGKLGALRCDVLKVPHHGSGHALEAFFRHPMMKPVVSVASMGEQGARSKRAHGTGAWQHPSTDVISWLGGAHRVYTTQLHERAFDWAALTTAAANSALYEPAHVLIETDGRWFRVLEIDESAGDLASPPPVTDVARGDGTRWIRAR